MLETPARKSCQSIMVQSHVVPVHIMKAYGEVEAQIH